MGQLERRLDAQPLDQVGRLAHEILQRHAADELGQLLDRARQLAPRARVRGQPPPDVADGEAQAGLLAVPAPTRRRSRPPRSSRARRAAWSRTGARSRAGAGSRCSTLRSTPGRPSQRSSDSPRACSSVASCARSTNARFAVRIRPSGSVTTKPSGALSTTLSTRELDFGTIDDAVFGCSGERRIRKSEEFSCRKSDAETRNSRLPSARRTRTSSARPASAHARRAAPGSPACYRHRSPPERDDR